MKKNSKASDHFKKLLQKADSSKQQGQKFHDYAFKKPTPIPKGMESVKTPKSTDKAKKILGVKVIPQRDAKSALEQLHCTHNQKYPLFYIEKADQLRMKKVESLSVKEQMIATRSIKLLSYEIQQWIHAQVSREVTALKEDSLEFQNLLQQREERHFRIDRIIRYLSDP